MTPTVARRNFGFDSMTERNKRLIKAIEEAQNIHGSIDLLAATEDKAILSSMGVVISVSESDTDMGDSDDADNTEVPPKLPDDLTSKDADRHCALPTFVCLHQVLEGASYDWFEVVEYAEQQTGCEYDTPTLKEYLDSFYSRLISTLEESAKIDLLEQSLNAFLESAKPPADASRMAAVLNGEIVTQNQMMLMTMLEF